MTDSVDLIRRFVGTVDGTAVLGAMFIGTVPRTSNALVDQLAPGEAFVGAVPVRDLFLAELPAEQDGFAIHHAGEIEQADVEVFDLDADGVDLVNGVFHALEGFIAFGATAGIVGDVNEEASGEEKA